MARLAIQIRVVLGPLLGAMQHAKDLYGLGPHAVGSM
jgi:hypothetical protein